MSDFARYPDQANRLSYANRLNFPNLMVNVTGMDPDAQQFINTSGARDRDGINRFVKGVKSLGLWSSMVCWPLRSSQNAGTGTTAFSLGGLGTFNGTLVNGPTWSDFGVVMGLNQRITTSAAATQPDTIFSVLSYPNIAQTTIAYDGGTRQHLYRNAASANYEGFAGTSVILNSVAQGSFAAWQLTFNGANGSSSINGAASIARNFGANNLTAFRMGSASAGNDGGTQAFEMIIQASTVPLLYDLYKSTLGQGLGLP